MKTTFYSLALAAVACGFAAAQTTAYTTPVGYVSQTCLKSSDTVIGIPLRVAVGGAGALSVAPDVVTTPGSAILTIAGTPAFVVDAFKNVSFVRFTSGPANGKYYAVTGNTASTITVNLNGDVLTAVAPNTLVVSNFWTLNTLFNPAVTTNSSATTGNAIVNSASVSNGNRRTQLFFANITTANINLAPSATYYVLADGVNPAKWVRVGDALLTDQGATQLWPDISMTLRNPAVLAGNTTYTCVGEVETGTTVTPLLTRVGAGTAQRDNPRMLQRPVDVTLSGLQLGGSSSFVTSASVSNGNRRDQLFVYDNNVAVINKAPSATYYYLAAQVGPPASPDKWVRVGDATLTDSGNVVIPAGAGFFIRKYGTPSGTTAFWSNAPSY